MTNNSSGGIGFFGIVLAVWMLCWSGVCSLCWEGIAPTILSYSTADWRDCIAYLLGMLTYWALFKKQY